MLLKNQTLAVLGAGMMGSTLARGIVQADAMRPDAITVFDLHTLKARALADDLGGGATVGETLRATVESKSIVLLALKPNVLLQVLEEIAPVLTDQQIVVSIAAGIPIRRLEGIVAKPVPVIRAMPNTPCLVGAGATAVCQGTHATHDHLQRAQALFAAVGESIAVEEKHMDAVTALSGSGPAYVYLMIEAMSDAGVKAGLTRDLARLLAAQTVYGAAKTVMASNEHPAQLKDNVTTPGGTTIAALAVLERAGLRTALGDAIEAAINRSKELSSS